MTILVRNERDNINEDKPIQHSNTKINTAQQLYYVNNVLIN